MKKLTGMGVVCCFAVLLSACGGGGGEAMTVAAISV
jgi:hypothetical protein